MKKVELIIPPVIYALFKERGMVANWLQALVNGENYIFNDDTLVNVTYCNGSVIINSASVTNNFPISALKFIGKLIKTNKTVYIQTTNTGVIKHLKEKYGFEYDDMITCAYRIG